MKKKSNFFFSNGNENLMISRVENLLSRTGDSVLDGKLVLPDVFGVFFLK